MKAAWTEQRTCPWDDVVFTVTCKNRDKRYCSRQCCNRAKSITLPDSQWTAMVAKRWENYRQTRDAAVALEIAAMRRKGLDDVAIVRAFYRKGFNAGQGQRWRTRHRKAA